MDDLWRVKPAMALARRGPARERRALESVIVGASALRVHSVAEVPVDGATLLAAADVQMVSLHCLMTAARVRCLWNCCPPAGIRRNDAPSSATAAATVVGDVTAEV